jgi:hypothetical protein
VTPEFAPPTVGTAPSPQRWLKAFQKRKRIATKKEVIGLFKGIKQPLLNE